MLLLEDYTLPPIPETTTTSDRSFPCLVQPALPSSFSHFQPEPLPFSVYQTLGRPSNTTSSPSSTPAALVASSSAAPLPGADGLFASTSTTFVGASAHQSNAKAPAGPELSLEGAVDSARWTGNLPSLVIPPVRLPDLPPVGQVSTKRASGPTPRRNSKEALLADGLLQGPTGVQSRIKPFIAKLNHLLSRPDLYADCLTWDSEGAAFLVHHCSRFHEQVLPSSYGHGQSASFSRQLNVYGFRRLSPTELSARLDLPITANYSGWMHPLFRRGASAATLQQLNPRPSRARAVAKEEKARAAGLGKRRRDESEEDEAEEVEEGQTIDAGPSDLLAAFPVFANLLQTAY
ncbi:hypothetical protein JCM8547_000753 [Rhodosporidiobolus lusitaniae]